MKGRGEGRLTQSSKEGRQKDPTLTESEPAAGVFFRVRRGLHNRQGNEHSWTSNKRRVYGRYADTARDELMNSAKERALKILRQEK